MATGRKSRFTTRDYVDAFGDYAQLLWKHRGNVDEVKKELDEELDWMRSRAQHGDLDG